MGSLIFNRLWPSAYESTLNGEPEYVTGHTGEQGDFAPKFDGIDDSVTTDESFLNDLEELTMSLWVRMEELQLGDRIGFFGQNDAIEFGLINPTQRQWWSPTGALNVNFDDDQIDAFAEWTHIAVTLNEDGITAYSNGEEIGTVGGGGPVNSGDTVNIGGDGIYDGSGNFFLGELDDLAIWNEALSVEQIQALADGSTTPLGPARGRIPFQITSVVLNPATDEVTITWPSSAGETFAVSWTEDLTNFVELGDGIEGGDGSTSYVDESVLSTTRVRYLKIGAQELLQPLILPSDERTVIEPKLFISWAAMVTTVAATLLECVRAECI